MYTQSDTSLLYSTQAFHEAEALHYMQGMADAMFNKGKNEKNIPAQEQDYLKAISFYQQCNNVDTLGQVYFRLGDVLNTKANFPASIAAYKKAEQLYLQANDSIEPGCSTYIYGIGLCNKR